MKQHLGVPGHVLLACLGMALCLAGCKTLPGLSGTNGQTPRVTIDGRTGTYTLDNDGLSYKPPNGGQPPGATTATANKD